MTSSKLNLTEDESDLVYHVVCSRDRPDGEPAAGSQAVRHVLVHDRRGEPAHRGDPGAAPQGVRVHERVQPRGAEQRRRDRQGALLAADRRAGGHAAGRPLGHQPGVLRGRLAGDPLPEEGREDAEGRPRGRVPDGRGLPDVHRPAVHAAHDRRHHRPDAVRCREQRAGRARQLAAQVPRLPHAGGGPAGPVLLGGGRRHQRQRVEVRARQLPADAGHGTRLDPQRHARGRHGVRHRAEPGTARGELRGRRNGSATTNPASSATTARSPPSASSSTTPRSGSAGSGSGPRSSR